MYKYIVILLLSSLLSACTTSTITCIELPTFFYGENVVITDGFYISTKGIVNSTYDIKDKKNCPLRVLRIIVTGGSNNLLIGREITVTAEQVVRVVNNGN